MGKRELRKLEAEQAARSAARCAVYDALWQRPAYVRMAAHLQRLNRAVTLAERDGTPAEFEAALRRFRRYHRRIIAVETAALAAAGLSH